MGKVCRAHHGRLKVSVPVWSIEAPFAALETEHEA